MGVKSRDDCPSLHMIFDRYCGVVEPEEASREAVAGVGLEPDLCVDGEVGVCFEFGNDFPILIPQHSDCRQHLSGSRHDRPELGRFFPRHDVQVILFDHGGGVVGFQSRFVDAFVVCHVH